MLMIFTDDAVFSVLEMNHNSNSLHLQQFNFEFSLFFFAVIAPKLAEAFTNALKIEMIDFGPFIYFGKVRTLYI